MCIASGIIGGACTAMFLTRITFHMRVDHIHSVHGEPPKVPAPTHGEN